MIHTDEINIRDPFVLVHEGQYYLYGTRGSGSVNVRWAPSLDSTLIQAYAYGSTMQVIADLGDWYQVTDPVTGITGFVMKKFAFIN